MSDDWMREFRQRLEDFDASRNEADAIAVSIKVRVVSGCFHREHSPAAYRRIDAYLAAHPIDQERERYLEHETGPEILVYLAVTAAALGVAKSVIDLVTTIVKARFEGIKQGDSPKEPLEIIVRGFRTNGEYFQETTIRIENSSEIDPAIVKQAIDRAFKALPKP